MKDSVVMNPRERVLICLLRSQRAIRISIRGSKISCAELHFVPVLRSLLRRASIYQSGFISERMPSSRVAWTSDPSSTWMQKYDSDTLSSALRQRIVAGETLTALPSFTRTISPPSQNNPLPSVNRYISSFLLCAWANGLDFPAGMRLAEISAPVSDRVSFSITLLILSVRPSSVTLYFFCCSILYG